MKHFIAASLLLLGCAESPVIPPPAKVLPTYTIEEVVIRLAISEPGVECTLLLVGDKWIRARTFAQWRDVGGKVATIVRQSDGQNFVTVDGLTATIEDEPDGESVPIPDKQRVDRGIQRNPR